VQRLAPLWALYPLVVLGAFAVGVRVEAGGRVALLPPALVSAGLLATFARSLGRGRTPIIAAIARRSHGGRLSPERAAYCRTVTRVWCAFFAANALVAAALAFEAPVRWWALYTGILSYVAVAALFAAEYLVRRHRFPSQSDLPG